MLVYAAILSAALAGAFLFFPVPGCGRHGVYFMVHMCVMKVGAAVNMDARVRAMKIT
jgi:hypothetical protein